MMTNPCPADPLSAVHDHGRSAARWLQVAGHRPDPGYWPIGTMHPAWHILVDPGALAGERLWAVRSLLPTLDVDLAVEQRESAKARSRSGHRNEWDPHDAVWRTTLHGAAFETARQHLVAALKLLANLGVEPQGPTPEQYALVSNYGRPSGRLIRS